jgi:archaellum component FlaF (FlaF/FlaG flagellin family)
LDKVITTTFLIIVSVICATLVFNSVYPAIMQSSDAMTNMKSRVDDRLKSQIAIIHAAGSAEENNASVWVKNVGALSIRAVESCDVILGPEGNFERIPHHDEPGREGTPYWTYEVPGNDSFWNPTATLQITVTYGNPLEPEIVYFVKVVIPNGISDEYYFSVSE